MATQLTNALFTHIISFFYPYLIMRYFFSLLISPEQMAKFEYIEEKIFGWLKMATTLPTVASLSHALKPQRDFRNSSDSMSISLSL